MNLQNIISEIEKIDPEVYERFNSRRNLFRAGAKLAAAAIPVALGSAFNKAYAQTSMKQQIIDILNFALTLEHLEAEFYNIGFTTPGLIPNNSDRRNFQQIRSDENQHTFVLKSTIQSMGGMAIEKPRFDFTAKGAFPTVFSNYDVFKTVAQAFEDTGVRAYKGQAPNLMSDKNILQAALQIHSVEARHAAVIRNLRGAKPWIPFSESNGAPAAVYQGENAVIQLTPAPINVSSTVAFEGISDMAVSESFDEPLTRDQVLAIVRPFLA